MTTYLCTCGKIHNSEDGLCPDGHPTAELPAHFEPILVTPVAVGIAREAPTVLSAADVDRAFKIVGDAPIAPGSASQIVGMLCDQPETTADDTEAAWTRGHRAAWLSLLRTALSELGYEGTEAEAAKLAAEREATVATLREVCGRFGDNDWPDRLRLSDVIEKHLARRIEDLVALAERIRDGRYNVRTELNREDRKLFDQLAQIIDERRAERR